jgi:hypothetical protein
VDHERLLAQIVQGQLAAHARLDVMEDLLAEATSLAVSEHVASGMTKVRAGQTEIARHLQSLNGKLNGIESGFQGSLTSGLAQLERRTSYFIESLEERERTRQGSLQIALQTHTSARADELIHVLRFINETFTGALARIEESTAKRQRTSLILILTSIAALAAAPLAEFTRNPMLEMVCRSVPSLLLLIALFGRRRDPQTKAD